MNIKFKDIIFGRFPKTKRTYEIIVSLFDKLPTTYNIVVSLIQHAGYSVVVTLNEYVKPTYNIVVTLLTIPEKVYDIVVHLQGELLFVPTPRDIIVSLQEKTDTLYDIRISLVEGGESSGCIKLDC